MSGASKRSERYRVRVPLSERDKATLRAVIVEAVRNVREDTPDSDDRLASFFGYMLGRAGFQTADDPMTELLR